MFAYPRSAKSLSSKDFPAVCSRSGKQGAHWAPEGLQQRKMDSLSAQGVLLQPWGCWGCWGQSEEQLVFKCKENESWEGSAVTGKGDNMAWHLTLVQSTQFFRWPISIQADLVFYQSMVIVIIRVEKCGQIGISYGMDFKILRLRFYKKPQICRVHIVFSNTKKAESNKPELRLHNNLYRKHGDFLSGKTSVCIRLLHNSGALVAVLSVSPQTKQCYFLQSKSSRWRAIGLYFKKSSIDTAEATSTDTHWGSACITSL